MLLKPVLPPPGGHFDRIQHGLVRLSFEARHVGVAIRARHPSPPIALAVLRRRSDTTVISGYASCFPPCFTLPSFASGSAGDSNTGIRRRAAEGKQVSRRVNCWSPEKHHLAVEPYFRVPLQSSRHRRSESPPRIASPSGPRVGMELESRHQRSTARPRVVPFGPRAVVTRTLSVPRIWVSAK